MITKLGFLATEIALMVNGRRGVDWSRDRGAQRQRRGHYVEGPQLVGMKLQAEVGENASSAEHFAPALEPGPGAVILVTRHRGSGI